MFTICPLHDNEHKRAASSAIGYCGSCISEDANLLQRAMEKHRERREKDGLVSAIPTDGKIVCSECGNHCRLDEDEIGFCHLRKASNGQIKEMYDNSAILSYYFDPLPTNCVADWICPIVTQRELGLGKSRLKNLAVFYGSCNSDCFFCQNAGFREMMVRGEPLRTPKELAAVADDTTACVCYFGGDPACNAKHSIETSRLLYEERGIKICYETNGNISRKWMDSIADIIEMSGGTLKFDLKALTPEIYTALTGVKNNIVLNNFRRLALRGRSRNQEFLVASVLLIPGYINLMEVRKISELIANCDSTIPTALLGFFPHHMMKDLPRTSLKHAEAALEVSKETGLTNVRIGNIHLLSRDKYAFD